MKPLIHVQMKSMELNKKKKMEPQLLNEDFNEQEIYCQRRRQKFWNSDYNNVIS